MLYIRSDIYRLFAQTCQWRIQDLTLGVHFVNGGGEEEVWKIIESVNFWNKSPILACFDPISNNIMLKMYRERNERKNYWENLAFWA